MKLVTTASLGIISIIVLGTLLSSKDDGWWSGTGTRSRPSCGQCHQSNPGSLSGFPPINVSVRPSARSLNQGELITVATSASGGNTTSTKGGFASDVSDSTGALAGQFTASGANTKLERGGRAIVHRNASSRSWTYGYTAPNTTGWLEMYAVVATVDGNRSANSSDFWAFHGDDEHASQGTPVRLYVNAPGVVRWGSGCVGPFGNWPVLGAKQSPTSPNPNFALELVGAPAGASITLFLGAPAAPPLALDTIGIQGCSLNVFPAPVTLAVGVTSGTPGSKFGDGAATIPIAIPSGIPPGTSFAAQFGIVSADPVAGRNLPITMTNGLVITTM